LLLKYISTARYFREDGETREIKDTQTIQILQYVSHIWSSN